MSEARGLFGWIGVVVQRWPWAVIGFWIALAAVLSVTIPPLTEMAAKRPVPILPNDAPVLVTTRQISQAFNQSGSENENVVLVVLTDDNGLNPSDLTTYRTLADNLRPDTRDIVMLQDFIHTPALREAMTSKDHKAWYLPMVLSGWVGTPELHAAYGRVADIVKKSVAGTTLTANLTGPAATGDDIVWADAVIFGTPTRFGSPAAQLRTFIDSLGGLWADGKLADKAYAGYTSSNTAHGGQETTLLSLYITLIHWGGIIVPPGYTDPCKFVDGNPYGASLVATHDNIDEIDDATNAALDHLARRVVTVAGQLRS